MTNIVRYTGLTDRGPSTKLWKGNEPRYGEWFNNPNKGWGVFDDFLTFGATANQYTLLNADGGAIVPVATEVGGVLRLTVHSDDEDETGISYGLATSVLGKIDAGAGACAFETRIRISSVLTGTVALAVGMGEEAIMAANMMADATGIMVDKDFVGFQTLAASGSLLKAVHNTASGGGTTNLGTAGTMVADTWFKVGWYFNGIDKTTYYYNGVAMFTVLESATNFPDGEELTFALYAKSMTGAGFNVDCDWWAFAQEAA
jgi:hypothetical protein